MTTGVDGQACARCGSVMASNGMTCAHCGSPAEATTARSLQSPVAPTAPPTPAAAPHAPVRPANGSVYSTGLTHGVSLASGETVRYHAEFSPHLIASHLKVTLLFTDRRVIVRKPHALFGFIPYGYVEEAVPLVAVSEVIAGDRLLSAKLVWGTLLGVFGLMVLFEAGTYGAFGVLFALAAFAAAAYAYYSSRVLGVFVRNHGGGVIGAPAGRGEHELVEQSKVAISELLFADGGVAVRRR